MRRLTAKELGLTPEDVLAAQAALDKAKEIARKRTRDRAFEDFLSDTAGEFVDHQENKTQLGIPIMNPEAHLKQVEEKARAKDASLIQQVLKKIASHFGEKS